MEAEAVGLEPRNDQDVLDQVAQVDRLAIDDREELVDLLSGSSCQESTSVSANPRSTSEGFAARG